MFPFLIGRIRTEKIKVAIEEMEKVSIPHR